MLATQTNLAFQKCTGYIQGDETLHENDYENILNAVKLMEKRSGLEGPVFDYIHFYCNSNIVKRIRDSYRREVHLIRNTQCTVFCREGQGFKAKNGKKLCYTLADATVYHYGWARVKDVMKRKVQNMGKLYHGKDFSGGDNFDYARIWGVREFKGSHPKYMAQWIEENKNDIDVLSLKLDFRLTHIRNIISDFVEDMTGYRIGEYKNYKLL